MRDGEPEPDDDLVARLAALQVELDAARANGDRQRRILDAILLQSPYGMMLADREGRFLVENEASKSIWAGSVAPEKLEEWRAYRAFHPDGTAFQPHDWGMAKALATGSVVEPREIQILRFDGTPGVLLGSAAPILGPDGDTDGALSVFADITRFKEHERALRLSSERYLATLKCIGDAVIATDDAGAVQFMNEVAATLTGWTIEEAAGRALSDVFQVDVDPAIGGEPSPPAAPASTRLTARSGRSVPIETTGAPIFDATGRRAGTVLVFRDVGKRQREAGRRRLLAEASTVLAASLDYQDTLKSVCAIAVASVADWCAVDIVDPNGTLRRLLLHHLDPAKRAVGHLYQEKYAPDPAADHGAHQVVRTGEPKIGHLPPGALEQLVPEPERLALLLELGISSYLIVPLVARDRTLGAITLISSDPEALYDDDDLAAAIELGRVAGFAIDNARLYSEAKEANGAKDQFLAVVSHELRTPLNAVLGWAQLLRRGGLSDTQRQLGLEVIERNARIQAQLVDDLLDVSRIAPGKLRLDVAHLDLGALLREVVHGAAPAAVAAGVQLSVATTGVHAVLGDAGRLAQVISNLLSNACKFTPRGGEVHVSLERVGDTEVLCVRDDGMGIDPARLGEVFDRFQQLSDGNARAHGGLGLGLAIVRSLVQLHGGSVEASSAGLGHGATFQVRLPASDTVERRSTVVGVPGAAALAGVRVLVVEDMADTRELIAVALRSRGAEVFSAASGFEGLATLAETRPDVVVSDIAMPGMDGYTFVRHLQERTLLERPARRPIPAVAVTAFASHEDRVRALDAGFQAHVAKPVDMEVLVATLCDVLHPSGSAAR